MVLDAAITVDLTAPSPDPAISVPSGNSVTLELAGYTLTVTGSTTIPAVGVPVGASLTINAAGGGTLIANGGYGAAGIGGACTHPPSPMRAGRCPIWSLRPDPTIHSSAGS